MTLNPRCIPIFRPGTPPFLFADATNIVAPPLGGLGYTPGQSYNLAVDRGAGLAVNVAFPPNVYDYYPMVALESVSFRSIMYFVRVVGGVGSVVRAGLYADNNGLPGQLLFDAGEEDGNFVAPVESLFPKPITVGPGQLIWGVMVTGVGGPQLSAAQSYAPPFGWSPGGVAPAAQYSRAASAAYGALPATAIPPTGFSIDKPCPIWLRTFA